MLTCFAPCAQIFGTEGRALARLEQRRLLLHQCVSPTPRATRRTSHYTPRNPFPLTSISPADFKQLGDRIPDASKDKKQRPGRRQPTAALDEPSVIFMPSEPVTQELQQVARIRRATVMPQSPADKHVIKGSMAKVIASGAGTSLQRRLLR